MLLRIPVFYDCCRVIGKGTVCIFECYTGQEDSPLARLTLENVSKVHPCTGTEALYRSYGP